MLLKHKVKDKKWQWMGRGRDGRQIVEDLLCHVWYLGPFSYEQGRDAEGL